MRNVIKLMYILRNEGRIRRPHAPLEAVRKTEPHACRKNAERKKIRRNAKKEREPILRLTLSAERRAAIESVRKNVHSVYCVMN